MTHTRILLETIISVLSHNMWLSRHYIGVYYYCILQGEEAAAAAPAKLDAFVVVLFFFL